MDHLIFFADIGGDLAKMGQETAQTFGVDWPHLIAQIISFSIVAILLHRFAYQRVLTVLEERRRKIAEGLQNAEKTKLELANAQVKAQEILNQASAQGARMIEEARAAAARVQEQETQKAIAAAKDIVEKARQASETEHARMLADLRREVGRLVVTTSAKVIGRALTAEDQQRLAEEASRHLAA